MAPPNPAFSSSSAVRSAAGEPFALVQVENLKEIIAGPLTGFGRPSQRQPVLVSAEISFAKPFGPVAIEDRLGDETVHYGKLSQAILDSLASFITNTPDSPPASLRQVTERIWIGITGQRIDGSPDLGQAQRPEPLLSPAQLTRVRFLSVTVHLPKGSLLGEGVSLTASSAFSGISGRAITEKYGISLTLHRLCIPTLIGIHAYERERRQRVVTTVTVDRFALSDDRDIYADMEELVTQCIVASELETLEALGAHVADCVSIKYRVTGDIELVQQWLIHVRMEKPMATLLADQPVVEVRLGRLYPWPGRPSAGKKESPPPKTSRESSPRYYIA